MGYEVALSKAYSDLKAIAEKDLYSLRFLSDEYEIDLKKKSILSLSCNIPAPAYISILLLHYLKKRLAGLPALRNEWIAFQQLIGGQGYYPAFKKRAIDRIVRKYGEKPDAILGLLERFKAKRVQLADISIVIEVFDSIPILIELWKGDDEFGPSADILFDKNIQDIFCTEDIAVLAECLVSSI